MCPPAFVMDSVILIRRDRSRPVPTACAARIPFLKNIANAARIHGAFASYFE